MKTVLSILASGLLFFFGNGLTGDLWFLVWLAPIPIIYLAIQSSAKWAFGASFVAYSIGKLSWFGYLVKITAVIPTIIFISVLALFFAGIIMLTRSAALKLNPRYSVFAFPIFFTLFEYAIINFSPHGTALSIAYSQMDCLPLIQIASVAGILGITFIITLIPSTIAFAILFKNKMLIPIAIVCGVLLLGSLRLNDRSSTDKIKVGLIAMDDAKHNTSDKPDASKDKAAADFYLSQIDSIAQYDVSLILLPERALSIDKLSDEAMLTHAAAKNNIYIIAGYTNLKETKEYNSALIINNKGEIIGNYNKVHLIPGLEGQITPGNSIGLFKLNNIQSGIAICKDLDFQGYMRRYAKDKPGILFIPAWDFIVDDWLHSRMAILRGVENGFSEVRSTRSGRLTISDAYGRVTYESGSNEHSAALIGYVPTQHLNTLYASVGDWLGIVCLLLSVFYFFDFKRLRVSGAIPR
jgi:apolipoprotein N-acyltransferase